MKRKLGINSTCMKDVDTMQALPMLKEAGFECYFMGESDCNNVLEIKALGDSIGLPCEFIHAPFHGINNMWLSGMGYLDIYKKMKFSIDAAADAGISTVICHVSSGWDAPEVNDLGIARFDSLVEYATDKKVNIAFENLRKIGNLAYFVDRYEKMEYVGYCYDIGHEHCYTKTIDWMDIFQKKTIATHIHDNFGRGEEKEGDPDLHLLPFDGNIDYEHVMRKLDEYEYSYPLILEVNNHRYSELSHKEFLDTCYERLLRISKM